MTGAPFGMTQAFAQPQMQAQPTGFIMPQHTSTNPFGLMQQQQQQQPPQQPAPFLQPQHTAFLQPQATGVNPFRQSMLLPQMTGMAAFGQQQPPSTNPFPVQNTGQPFGTSSTMPQFNAFATQIAAPSAQPPNAVTQNGGPARPASAPLTALPASSSSSSGPPPAQPVKAHQTGSRNPFGVPVSTPPPMPKPPTLFELAMGASHPNQQNGQPGAQQQQQQQQQQTSPTSGFAANGFGSQLNSQPTGSVMAGVASSFTFNKPGENSTSMTKPLNPQQTATTTTGSAFSDTLFSSTLSSQPTGATVTSSAPSISISSANPLQPQKTGFSSGLKPFKPSSSFGAALLESLPPIPSEPTTPGETPQSTQNGNPNASQGLSSGLGSQPTGMPGFGGLNSQPTGAFGSSLTGIGSQPTGALNSQPTGAFSALGKAPGVGLRPQMTGTAGGANPFRASMFPMTTGLSSAFGNGNNAPPMPSFLGSSPTGVGGPQFGMSTSNSAPSFSTGQFGQQPQQQQQNGSASLI